MIRVLKILFKVLAVFLIIAMLILAYLKYMPDVNLKKEKADLQINAAALLQEYETNQSAGDTKFIDKVIDVTGNIAEISTDQKGAQVVILREGDAFAGVMCTLKEDQKSKLEKYKIGKSITIRGMCTGMLMDVVLNKCIIIEE